MQLIYAVYLLGLIVLFSKAFRKRDPEDYAEEEREMSYSDLSEAIEEIAVAKKKIDAINDIIADIESCSPGLVNKTIIISVPESEHSINLLTTGEDVTADFMKKILENERDELATSLKVMLRKIK